MNSNAVQKYPKISARALLTPPSPIRKLSGLANRAKIAGTHIYHLNIGQPDLLSPPEFFEGLKTFKDKVLAYEDSRGLTRLREAWSAYTNKTSPLSTSPDDFIITTGASEALIFAFNVCCDADDEILVFDPSYANYISFAAIAGVALIPVRCSLDDDFALPARLAIESRISHRTKAILFCNPNNPTGSHYAAKDLQLLIEICNERNIFLIVDETYREFVFDGRKPISVLELAPENPRVIVVDSLSKRFSLCGARIGCIITRNASFMQAALAVAQARLSCSTIEQVAAAYMLERISPDYVEKMRLEYEGRRNALLESLKQISGVKVASPQGAFYAMAQLPVDDAELFSSFLLTDFSFGGASTFIAPAQGFYLESERGKKEARIAFVLDKGSIEKAIEILGHGLIKYNSIKK